MQEEDSIIPDEKASELHRKTLVALILALTVGAPLVTVLLPLALSAAGPTNPWDRYNWIFSQPEALIISGGGETGLIAAADSNNNSALPPGTFDSPTSAAVSPSATSTVVQINGPDPSTTQQTTQSETSIAATGSGKTTKLVVGFNDATDCCVFPGHVRLSGFSFSVDGGRAWTDGGTLPNPSGGGFAATIGDPAVVFNPITNRFYYATLIFDSNGISLIGVSMSNIISSSTTSITFGAPVVASTNVQATHFQDKEYIGVDPTNGFLYVSWTDFAPGGADAIRVARSVDGGFTFQPSVIVGSGLVQGSTPAVDPVTEQVFVAWESFTGSTPAIMITRSDDFGQTFTTPIRVSPVNPIGNSHCSNGRRTIAPLIQATFGLRRSRYAKARVLDFPTLAVDPANGQVYIAWNNQEGSFGSDIAFSRSLDHGDTWSTPTVANAPRADEQFMPWLTAPSTNRIDIAYYSIIALNDPRTSQIQQLEVRLAESTDGGQSFRASTSISGGSFPFGITDRNFDPIIATCYMGDYIGITSGQSTLFSSWGDNRNLVTVGGRYPFPARNDPDVFFTSV